MKTKINLFKKCVAEFLGAFAIVWGGCGAVIANQLTGGQLGPVGIGLVFGVIVAVMIYAMGHISGAHFNPAVTLAFAAARHFPVKEILPYIVAQCLGGVAGSLVHKFTLSAQITAMKYGVTQPFDGRYGTAIIWELILTYFLMLVIMSVATDSRAIGKLAGVAIGGTVMFEAIFAGPFSGASMNPARSLGPALVSGQSDMLSAYLLAPVVGALLGALTYKFIKCETDEQKDIKGCC